MSEVLPQRLAPPSTADKETIPRWRVFLRWLRRLLLRKLPAEEAAEVRQAVEEEARFTERYAMMCALSAGIATLGLLQSSSAVVIGAMLVSPLMSPIAGLGFSFASFDARRAQESARVLAIGAAVGIAVGMLLTWLSPIRNPTPEIIARTAPTLLDLAVAVLSGIAGGYATVHRRGETAIGVAIATALMPPLATVGYSLAVGRMDFVLGSGLLFLTNLAAISFCFALVARVRGVERPFGQVEVKTRYVVMGVAAFLVLATPLALTLRRVTREAIATQATRQAVEQVLKVDQSHIAQLSVHWPNGEPPRIDATVVAPRFDTTAPQEVRARLAEQLDKNVELNLEQIVAADPRAQAEAIVNAALRANGATATQDAPTEIVRAASTLPISYAWSDAELRVIHLLAAPNGGLSGGNVGAYRTEEARLNKLGFSWAIEIVPPAQPRLPVLFGDDLTAIEAAQTKAIDNAVWALARWKIGVVSVEGLSGANTGATRVSRILARNRAANVAAALRTHGVSVTETIAPRETSRDLAQAGGAPRVRCRGHSRVRRRALICYGCAALHAFTASSVLATCSSGLKSE